MTYEEIAKQLGELIEKTANAAKGFGGNAWSLLVEAEKASALAGLISSAMGFVFAVSLYLLAYRLYGMAKKMWEQGPECLVPGIAALVVAVVGYCDLNYVWNTFPMAVAKYRHPAAFVALQAIDRVAPPK